MGAHAVLADEKAIAPSELASRMGMTRGAISKLADRLIAKSMLKRTADPKDGRAQTLALTSAGRALVPSLAALADTNDMEFFKHLTAVSERNFCASAQTRRKEPLPRPRLWIDLSAPIAKGKRTMDDRLKMTAEECLRGAENNTMTFPQIVGKLMDAGFESYCVDYRRAKAIITGRMATASN